MAQNSSKIDEIIKQIKELDKELKQEYVNRAKEFYYDFKKNRFDMSSESIRAYKKDVVNSFKYIWRSGSV